DAIWENQFGGNSFVGRNGFDTGGISSSTFNNRRSFGQTAPSSLVSSDPFVQDFRDNAFSVDEAFSLAEEKATKAIQRHSMIIRGTERNPQMVHAFFLLGKARYFDQRYFPALEAFNYILERFEDDELLQTVKIWREK